MQNTTTGAIGKYEYGANDDLLSRPLLKKYISFFDVFVWLRVYDAISKAAGDHITWQSLFLILTVLALGTVITLNTYSNARKIYEVSPEDYENRFTPFKIFISFMIISGIIGFILSFLNQAFKEYGRVFDAMIFAQILMFWAFFYLGSRAKADLFPEKFWNTKNVIIVISLFIFSCFAFIPASIIGKNVYDYRVEHNNKARP